MTSPERIVRTTVSLRRVAIYWLVVVVLTMFRYEFWLAQHSRPGEPGTEGSVVRWAGLLFAG